MIPDDLKKTPGEILSFERQTAALLAKWEARRVAQAPSIAMMEAKFGQKSGVSKEEAARRAREQWARSVLAEGGDPNTGEIPVSPTLEALVRTLERLDVS